MPTSNSASPERPFSTDVWGRLFLGGAAAAVLALAALVLWRFAQVLHPDQPAASGQAVSLRTTASPRQVVAEPAEPMPAEEGVPAPAEDIPAAQKQPPRDPEPAQAELVAPKPQPLTADQIVERRLQKGEEELRRELLAVPEVRLISDHEVKQVRADEKAARKGFRRRDERERSDYSFNVRLHQAMKGAAVQSGLALRSEFNCRLDSATASVMANLSKSLRDLGFVSVPGGPPARRTGGRALSGPGTPADPFTHKLETLQGRVRRGPVPPETTPAEESPQQKQEAFQAWCDRNKLEQYSGTLPTLLQMLQVEDVPIRLVLVRELARIQSAGSTTALASRAIMDLSPEVRAAAIAALQARPPGAYVPVLVRALRYPWPPVAGYAAVALRELHAEGAVPGLVDLLDQPDPSAPTVDPKTRQSGVCELVRLNHMRNCLLCHAPSVNKDDGLVRGLVPTPGERLPQLYYEGQTGDFVRADITYLHQDFSVVLRHPDSHPWPEEQRFDFVTRRRDVPADEVTRADKTPNIYPQRQAVLYALRGLTRKDAGDSSTRWRAMLGLSEKKEMDKTAVGITNKPTISKQEMEKKPEKGAPSGKDITRQP
jgi:hypothetical protein